MASGMGLPAPPLVSKSAPVGVRNHERLVAAQNAHLIGPTRVSGIALTPVAGGAPTYLYLHDEAAANVVEGALALHDALVDGELAQAIRAGPSFGMMLGVSAGRTLYLSGSQDDASSLHVRLEDGSGGKFDVRPVYQPHDGWASSFPLVAAHYLDGRYFDDASDGMRMQVLRDVLDEVRSMMAARHGSRETFTARVFSPREDKYSASAFVDVRAPGHPQIEITLRYDGGDLPKIVPIVLGEWSASVRFVAAF